MIQNQKQLIFSKSMSMYQEALKVTPGGIHSNVRWRKPHPFYYQKAKGSRIWDVDGNEFIDFLGNYGALILGHGDEDVKSAVEKQLAIGLTTGTETKLNIDVAEKLIAMIPCAEMVRFSNTGTEAVMHAIHMARGYTGKQRILKTEGNYHGWYDYVFCSHRYPEDQWRTPKAVPSSSGLVSGIEDSTLVVPWNDYPAIKQVVEQYGKEIAAIIMEPVNHNIGCAMPGKGYLEKVRKLTKKHDILLIFDEVITGFRSAPGGAQEYLGVTPDLATFGKTVANGFPLSVVAGTKEVMSIISPVKGKVAFGGTYNGNQIVVAAADAVLDKMKDGSVQKHMIKLTDKLISSFNTFAEDEGLAARLQGFGGKFQIYFTDHEIYNWRTAVNVDQDRYIKLQNEILQQNILLVTSPFSHNALTGAHTEEEIDTLLEKVKLIVRNFEKEK